MLIFSGPAGGGRRERLHGAGRRNEAQHAAFGAPVGGSGRPLAAAASPRAPETILSCPFARCFLAAVSAPTNRRTEPFPTPIRPHRAPGNIGGRRGNTNSIVVVVAAAMMYINGWRAGDEHSFRLTRGGNIKHQICRHESKWPAEGVGK